MNALSTVRHGVRGAAARTRRTLLWTPHRFRTAIGAAVAVLVLLPVGSLVVRQPWDQAAAGSTDPAATDLVAGDGTGGLVDGLSGTPPGSASSGLGATGDAQSTAPADEPPAGTEPVDASAVPLRTVLDAEKGTSGSGRTAGAAGQPTLSPDGANSLWKAQARLSAARFAQAWLTGPTASSVDAWLRDLDPWLDPGSRQLVALTNLAAIPRTSVTSVQLRTLEEAEGTAVVWLADRGRVDVELAWDGERWRVTSYEPVAAVGVPVPTTSGPTSAPASTTATTTGTAAAP